MYKSILVGISVLSFSQVVLAERSEIFSCLDKSTIVVKESCMVSTIEKHTARNAFFDTLAEKNVITEKDAFAVIKYYPKENLTVVKSIEDKSEKFLAAN